MPNIQTTFVDPPKGIEGMPDFAFDRDTISYHVTSTSAIPFGRAVRRGSDDRGIQIGIQADDTNPWAPTAYRGFTTCDMTREGAEYKTGDVANVQTSGVLWVRADGAVTAGSRVSVTESTGRPGAAASGSATVGIIDAVWLDDAANNGLARIRLHQRQVGTT